MSTWKELHDDFLQRLLLYVEDLKITPQQVMRYLTAGQSDFQRRTRLVVSSKLITPVIPVVPLRAVIGTQYPLGDDVLSIVEAVDQRRKAVQMMEYSQYQNEVERANPPDRWMGTNEASRHRGYMRKRDEHPMQEWNNASGTGAHYVGCVWENTLLVYPDDRTEDITLHYEMALHPYSSSSPQWAAWFPEQTNFFLQFTTSRVRPEIGPYEQALVEYAVASHLRALNDQEKAALTMAAYNGIVAEAIENKPSYYSGGQAAYNLSPFSS